MATAMTPLADVRTLKPNGMALGPLNGGRLAQHGQPGVRPVRDRPRRQVRPRVTNPDGDPRTQTITIVAATGDGRGANGTQGFIGNHLYISGNRATQFFDVTLVPERRPTGVPDRPAPACGMASVPAPAPASSSPARPSTRSTSSSTSPTRPGRRPRSSTATTPATTSTSRSSTAPSPPT